MRFRAASLPALLLCAASLAACGGSAGGGSATRSTQSPATAARGGKASNADPATVKVIRRWADSLRKGEVEQAARLFAIPSVVQNGSPLLTVRSAADARVFNEALPCGARLVTAERRGAYTVATFELTDRPGGGCGTGIGGRARTAFVVRAGKIRAWLRVPDAGPLPPVPAPGGDPRPPPAAPGPSNAPVI